MTSKIRPKARRNDIVIQPLKEEILIYDLAIHQAYCLNETSALVWNLCDGSNSVSDISRELSRKLKSPVTEDFVRLALNELKKKNLLEKNLELSDKFDGLSRREIIRRVGLTSMIALPVIASLVAPTIAMALSSACPPGSPNPSGTAAGQPTGSPIISSSSCGSTPNATRDNLCDLAFGDSCCSTNAVSSNCVNTPSGSTFTCVCA